MALFSRANTDRISSLARGEIFVFGSNDRGNHAGGAARQAVKQYGAVMGQAEGLQGRSYALVSMSGLDVLSAQVTRFFETAREHPELRFLVTEVGCGIAGHTPDDVAPLFTNHPSNVVLPPSFAERLIP